MSINLLIGFALAASPINPAEASPFPVPIYSCKSPEGDSYATRLEVNKVRGVTYEKIVLTKNGAEYLSTGIAPTPYDPYVKGSLQKAKAEHSEKRSENLVTWIYTTQRNCAPR